MFRRACLCCWRLKCSLRIDVSDGADTPALLGVVLVNKAKNAVVREIYVGSPAQRAGILPGDQLLAIDGRPLSSSDELVKVIGGYQPNVHVDVLVSRNEWTRHFDVKLAPRADVIGLRRTAGAVAVRQRCTYTVQEPGYLDAKTARDISDPYYRARNTRFGPN